ncbi:hypothetical protein [Pseudofrankia sp. DC12]|uniref:hypothetical protein n=1 Tax=Pseudofrankia sp. DC12 TaxID=683315 RepID=UPI000AB61E2C|nr:hypothetical protein [Pseudofrankia sp. DC12]
MTSLVIVVVVVLVFVFVAVFGFNATAAMCIDDPLHHHAGALHHLLGTRPPLDQRIAVLQHLEQGLTVQAATTTETAVTVPFAVCGSAEVLTRTPRRTTASANPHCHSHGRQCTFSCAIFQSMTRLSKTAAPRSWRIALLWRRGLGEAMPAEHAKKTHIAATGNL